MKGEGWCWGSPRRGAPFGESTNLQLPRKVYMGFEAGSMSRELCRFLDWYVKALCSSIHGDGEAVSAELHVAVNVRDVLVHIVAGRRRLGPWHVSCFVSGRRKEVYACLLNSVEELGGARVHVPCNQHVGARPKGADESSVRDELVSRIKPRGGCKVKQQMRWQLSVGRRNE